MSISSSQATSSWFQALATSQIHGEQLKNAERLNGRAAMIGMIAGIIVEGLTGQGIAHQIGLGSIADGFAACSEKLGLICF